MKIKELRKMMDLLDNEDAEVYINTTDLVDDSNLYWDSRVDEILIVNRKYVDSEKKLIAKKPCKVTENSREAMVLYVK